MAGAGDFIWYELVTTDAEAAQRFYGEVIGWGARPAAPGPNAYTLLTVGETPVAGLMTMPEEVRNHGGRPGWIGYVGAEDVDRKAEEVAARRGAVHRPPSDIPGVGRFAVVADPQGAAFVLMKGIPQDPPPPLADDAVGRAGWRELFTTDVDAAFGFYADLFGWTKLDALDMGAMGVYLIFAIQGRQAGGMMRRPPDMPVSLWNYYFRVDSAEAAAKRIQKAGGTVLMGPQQVPGGTWIVQAFDPQGAMFSVMSAER